MIAPGEPQRSKRIGLVASEPMRLAGFESLFSEDASVEIVSLTAVQALRAKELTLAVIDSTGVVHLFAMLDAFRRSRPVLKLIVMGPPQDPSYVQRVIGAGAKGYLSLTAGLAEVAMAVEIVLDGSIWAPRKVMARLLESEQAAAVEAAAAPVPLTVRERDVLHLLIDGGSNKAIAKALLIDEATVKAHVGRLLRKFGVSNRIALSMRAMQRKLG